MIHIEKYYKKYQFILHRCSEEKLIFIYTQKKELIKCNLLKLNQMWMIWFHNIDLVEDVDECKNNKINNNK